MTTVKYIGFIAILAMLLNACATTMRTDLYLGLSIPGGREVSPEQWQRFCDSIISPRFPGGYTEGNVAGRWKDTESNQTITEHTKVLTFIGRKSKLREANLDKLIQVYRQQFQQQAVLRTDARVRVRFIGL